ncbi:MAG: ABC transporter permease subunit [Spirochaetaceae bacterium]
MNKKYGTLLLMAIPGVLYFIIFHYIPMTGIVLAFKNFHAAKGIFGSPWVGFDNFKFLVISGTLGRVTLNTIGYNIVFYLTNDVLAVIIAIFISEMTKRSHQKFFQSLLFLPYFMSYVIMGVIAYNLMNYEYGVLNNIITSLGFAPVDFYNKPGFWPYIIPLFNIWKWVGYTSIIYMAAIVGIDQSQFEAAKIDGANIWDIIRHIILPELIPTFVILFLFRVGQMMRGQFDLFYNLVGNNSPIYESTDVIDTFVFRALVNNFDIGIGSATGVYQSVFGLILILSINAFVKRINADNALF